MAGGFMLGQTNLPAPTGALTPSTQQQWIAGISQAEGFNVPGSTPQVANNPGDLRLGDIGYGETNGVTNFPSVDAGTAALANQVNNFYTPPSGSPYAPDQTISEIAQTYTGGDNADGWATTVAQTLGTTTYATPVQAASGEVPSQSAVGISQSSASTNPQVQAGDPMPDPIAAAPLPNQTVSAETLADLTNEGVSVPDQVGLNVQPWYQDTNLLTGNPRLHKMGFPQGFPIVFEVYMDQNDTNSLLKTTYGSSSYGSSSLVGDLFPSQPVQIPLNCSLTTFKLSSRHIFNRTPTRTGFHLTLWGMTADTIEGSGSTGLFMNQFGVTDFLSLAGENTDAVNAVIAAYGNTPLTSQIANYNAAQTSSASAASALQVQQALEPFRIAAEDAFQEFLALFKMNGTTWLHPSGYASDSGNNNAQSTQNNANNTTALATYSTGIGATNFEIKARNNDVYKRGYVVMKYRNSQYLGFFKSLNWVMDATKPYAWTFSFVFQVERTLSLVYYPTPTAAPSTATTALAVSGAQ